MANSHKNSSTVSNLDSLLSQIGEKIESGILGKSVCLRKRFMILLSNHLSAMMHMQVIYFQKIYDLIEHHVIVI